MSAYESQTVVETNLPLPCKRGKVRDVYTLDGEHSGELLLVATDRISAYDVIMPTPIPGKGVMLTQISRFWFDWLGDTVAHHLLEVVEDRAPVGLDSHLDQLRGRTMRCRKTEVIPIECVVRGYLAGSGWADYCKTGSVCGVTLPAGLKQCERLPEPIFTPATKAETGHDLNVSFDEASNIAGREVMETLRARSIDIYRRASTYALQRGIIIADTKFEWGRWRSPDGDDQLLLIDEILTPDSSRFWPAESYAPGRDQDSFDKQYVRNHLTSLCQQGIWNKTPPGPALPDEIVRNTAAKYAEAVRRLTAQIPSRW